jgi:peptidoglycan hydrolase-like protein with peptidoglycan-binding domain
MNRRIIAAAQYQLMRRGYYRGRIDGSYGAQTAFGLRAFQSSAGLVPTGRLDMQTLDALRSSDADLAYGRPEAGLNEAWIPVRKFKQGKWKVKWKKYQREQGDEPGDEDRQANTVYGSRLNPPLYGTLSQRSRWSESIR